MNTFVNRATSIKAASDLSKAVDVVALVKSAIGGVVINLGSKFAASRGAHETMLVVSNNFVSFTPTETKKIGAKLESKGMSVKYMPVKVPAEVGDENPDLASSLDLYACVVTETKDGEVFICVQTSAATGSIFVFDTLN